MMVRGVVEWFNFIYTWMIYCFTVYIVYLSMLEQATFLSLKLEFENMVMSMLIINPVRGLAPFEVEWLGFLVNLNVI